MSVGAMSYKRTTSESLSDTSPSSSRSALRFEAEAEADTAENCGFGIVMLGSMLRCVEMPAL